MAALYPGSTPAAITLVYAVSIWDQVVSRHRFSLLIDKIPPTYMAAATTAGSSTPPASSSSSSSKHLYIKHQMLAYGKDAVAQRCYYSYS